MTITTVLLDLDETILYDDAASAEAMLAVGRFATSRAAVDPEELIAHAESLSAILWAKGPFPTWCDGIGTSAVEGLRARFEGDDPHWETMRTFGPGFRLQTWTLALANCGIDDPALAAELDDRFEQERAARNIFMPGASDAIDALVSTYRIGMITNGIPDVQRTKIVRANLTDRFEHITVSGEYGAGKPDTAIYRATAAAMRVSPEECLMVGDNLTNDALVPQEVGMSGCWLSLGRTLPAGNDPWLVVPSLAELPAALADRDVPSAHGRMPRKAGW